MNGVYRSHIFSLRPVGTVQKLVHCEDDMLILAQMNIYLRSLKSFIDTPRGSDDVISFKFVPVCLNLFHTS